MLTNTTPCYPYPTQVQPSGIYPEPYGYTQQYPGYQYPSQAQGGYNQMQSYGNTNQMVGMMPQNDTNKMYDQNAYNQTNSNSLTFNQQNQAIPQTSQATCDQSIDSSNAYTKFEDLPNPFAQVDLNTIIEPLKNCFEDKTNWRNPFQGLDNLRIINKYYPQATNNIITLFWKYIIECIENTKTHIGKNALLYITEVFENCKSYPLIDEILAGLIPHVLMKSVSEKSLIKSQAEVALIHVTNYCCNDTAIITLSSSCLDKNPNICEHALQTLGKMILNIGENLPKLSYATLVKMMNTLAKVLESAKKGNMKKWVSQICASILNLFGPQNYMELISATFTPDQKPLAELLIKCLEEKKGKDTGFQTFVSQQKKFAKMSMMPGSLPGLQQQTPGMPYQQQGGYNDLSYQSSMYMQQQGYPMQTSMTMNSGYHPGTATIMSNNLQNGYGVMGGFAP